MNQIEAAYYHDPYQKEIRATIVEIRAHKKHTALLLDQTIFYPEGGGQPGDIGTIDDVFVVDTQKDGEGKILHLIESQTKFEVGQRVDLTLNWKHRYDFMQQHTAQHLLSGRLYHLLQVGTLSVHFGQESFSIELDCEELPLHQIYAIEDDVNSIINKGVKVTDEVVTHQESLTLNLRRSVKVDTDVRLIHIDSYDTIACGGLHVKNTGELKYIQYVGSEKIRGHLRTFWSGGDRSVALIRTNRELVERASTLLSSPKESIADEIETLQTQLSEAHYHLNRGWQEVAHLLLEKHCNQSGVVLDVTEWDERAYHALDRVLLEIDSIVLCTIRSCDDGKILWSVVLKGVKEAQLLFQTIKKEALPLIEGRGGGKEPLWKGVGKDLSQREAFIEKVKSILND